jgi:ribosome biogenesis GTPase A
MTDHKNEQWYIDNSNGKRFLMTQDGLKEEGRQAPTYSREVSQNLINDREFVLESNYNGRAQAGANSRKPLEIKTDEVVSPNSKMLISDIAFYIDLENDFNHEDHSGMLEELLHNAYDLLVNEIKLHHAMTRVDIAIIGNFSSGKSSFINSLIGKELCPVALHPTTSSITKFIYSDIPKIVRMDTKEIISNEEYERLAQHEISDQENTQTYEFEYYYPFDSMRNIAIFDTPGFNNPLNDNDERVTLERANRADVIFLLIDVENGDIDKSIHEKMEQIRASNKDLKWYLIVNKADLKAAVGRENVLKSLQDKYSDRFEEIILYSSKVSSNMLSIDEQLEIILDTVAKKIRLGIDSDDGQFQLNLESIKSQSRVSSNSKLTMKLNGDDIGTVNKECIENIYEQQRQKIIHALERMGEQKNDTLLFHHENLMKKYKNKSSENLKTILAGLNKREMNISSMDYDFKKIINSIENFYGNQGSLNVVLTRFKNSALKPERIIGSGKAKWLSSDDDWKLDLDYEQCQRLMSDMPIIPNIQESIYEFNEHYDVSIDWKLEALDCALNEAIDTIGSAGSIKEINSKKDAYKFSVLSSEEDMDNLEIQYEDAKEIFSKRSIKNSGKITKKIQDKLNEMEKINA